MAEIAVIVPVYRAEEYLPACIDSILGQSYADFELILVDDGSPDGCGEICEDYAKRDSRITVIHQENQGQAAARNHALEISTAPWVTFVDSDDLIHPRTLEFLHRAAEKSGAPMVMCQMLEAPELPESFYEDTSGDFQVLPMDDETLSKMYDEGIYPAWVSCGKLIRRGLIEGHPFCPGRVYEDNEAVCHWAVAAGTLAWLPENLYFYRTNPGSTTQSGFSLKKLDFLWALEHIIKCYSHAGFQETLSRFLDLYILETAGFYRRALYDLHDKALMRKLKNNLRRTLKEEGHTLTGAQFRELLDAMHPKLMGIYWPAEGIARIMREEGMGGILRKITNRLGKGEQS